MKCSPQCKQRPSWFFSKAITRLGLDGSLPRRLSSRPNRHRKGFSPPGFNVPFDVRIGIFGEAGFSIREVKAVFLAMPVALFAPLVTFAGVLPFGRLAEFPVKLVIHSIEGAFGRIGAMVVRPAPDTRVECGDEGGWLLPRWVRVSSSICSR